MKKIFSLLIVWAVALHSIQAQQGELKIKGNIKDLDVDKLYLTISADDVVVEDSVEVKKGKFSYTVKTNGFTAVLFDPRFMANVGPDIFKKITQGKFSLYGEPGDVLKLTGEKLSYIIDYDVDGNEINNDFVSMGHAIAPYLDEKLVIDFNDELEAYYSPSGGMNFPGANSKEQQAQIDKLKADFIKEYPKSYYSMYHMALSADKDKLREYGSTLSDDQKKHYFGRLVDMRVASFDLNKKGAQVPEIAATDIYKKSFKLSSLRGKHVVLDFWGTWCGPCMQGVPDMKKYYKKYEGRIEYVGVACNEKKGVEGVIYRVEKSKMNWIHLMNGEDLNNYSKMFGVTGYPTKFIISPEGKVLGSFIGEGEHFYKFLDEAMTAK
ncbi:TlpA disulfide reductase family protein [Reichenbachiella sp.]|uniref:TlpA family protein disulfide reductase n=1 Tax=Reichenbachiella sp. TaxID=2184521 RepID=UPI0032969582